MKKSSLMLMAMTLGTPLTVSAQEATAPQSQPVQATPLRPYTVNAGDEIEVYVWGEERLQRKIRVLPDGTFSFPLVGKVNAVGQLPSQIEVLISKGLESQYRGQVPQVTVSVSSPSGLQFSVVGKVGSAGTFTPGRYVNLLEALSLAGGPAEFANLDNVTIVRKTPTGLITIRARMAGVFKNGASARDLASNGIPQIESGDTVIVP
ncbi:polysaccharide biosynthesis/export family protein [Sphingobium boeckii]|uniref:Polysaccharide export outer membrane protein n=1 Tax=Sphingobium boeckii TaxID=1082345 RepID=A0A7W9AJ41_9SPHN|nr:polysaccharide biosynthesis/export family protein [Sphingobium boeckii]MBB5686624.1 polysaccharide export outer membrane protein [Sphingobium boeckii]